MPMTRRTFLRSLLSTSALIAGGLSLTQIVRAETRSAGYSTQSAYVRWVQGKSQRIGGWAGCFDPMMVRWSDPEHENDWSCFDG